MQYVLKTGTTAIYEAEMALCGRFLAGARALPGVRIVGVDGQEDRVATVSLDFTPAGLDNAAVAYRLDSEHGVMTRCGMHCAPRAHKTLDTFPQGTVRFAFGHTNTAQEVDICLKHYSNRACFIHIADFYISADATKMFALMNEMGKEQYPDYWPINPNMRSL